MTVQNTSTGPESTLPPVRRIEMVHGIFSEESAPMWRVTVDKYCIDFETETAANNVRNAILSLVGVAQGADEPSEVTIRRQRSEWDRDPAHPTQGGDQGEAVRTALEWYANEHNYHPSLGAPMTPYIDGKPDPSKPPKDFGAIARAALAAPQPASNAYALEEPAILEMAKMIDCEAWVAIQDGRDTNAGSMWHLRRDWAKRKAHAIAASLPDLLSLPSTHSAPAAKHSGTFLGYRDEHGNEMHCANAFCPHQDKCHKGCVAPVAMTSTDGKSP